MPEQCRSFRITERGDAMILVAIDDGKCRSCGGQLEITGASDVTLQVQCTECDDSYSVETDAFNDGGITYWPQATAEFGEEL